MEFSLKDVWSDMTMSLASHHFVLLVTIELDIAKTPLAKQQPRWCLSDLRSAGTAHSFRDAFVDAMEGTPLDLDVDAMNSQIHFAFCAAASQTLSTQTLRPYKPWISQKTLDLISNRHLARENCDWELEREWHKSRHP